MESQATCGLKESCPFPGPQAPVVSMEVALDNLSAT